MDPRHGAIKGANERLPSIFMTAQVTALAMLQITFGSDNTGKEIMGPMASTGGKGVFGVPFFVYKDSIYWGNDRLEWLLREINDNFGTLLPDLTVDPFRRPY